MALVLVVLGRLYLVGIRQQANNRQLVLRCARHDSAAIVACAHRRSEPRLSVNSWESLPLGLCGVFIPLAALTPWNGSPLENKQRQAFSVLKFRASGLAALAGLVIFRWATELVAVGCQSWFWSLIASIGTVFTPKKASRWGCKLCYSSFLLFVVAKQGFVDCMNLQAYAHASCVIIKGKKK